MEQPTTIVLTERFYTSRTAIDQSGDTIIEDVRAGKINPLAVRVWIKTAEEIIERVKKETADMQMTEAGKYTEQSFEAYGATLTKAELGTKYDYRACNDTVWERLSTDADTAKLRLSEREAFLKALKEPLTLVDELTGEVVKISPPIKTSVTGLKITIK